MNLITANVSENETLAQKLAHSYQLDLVDFGEDDQGFHVTLNSGKDESFDVRELATFAKDLVDLESVSGQRLEIRFLDKIHISSDRKNRVTAANEGDDTVTFNVPALIRCLEIAREEVKTDDALHLFVEALQAAGNITLDTDMIVQAAKAVSNEG